MLMPEAAVHEHDLATRREYKVRSSGQVFAVQAVAIAKSMEQSAHLHFGLHALGFDLRHYAAANFGGYCISHFIRVTGTLPNPHYTRCF